MARIRATLFAFAAGLAAVAGPGFVTAQPAGQPQRPASYGDVATLKGAGPISKDALPKARAAVEAFAKYYADYVTYSKVYTALQEFRPEPPPAGSPLTVDQMINEINRHLLVPSPVAVLNPVVTQPSFTLASGAADADYIRELGTALDKSLGDVVRNSNERVVRVNAARLLAAACRSGAQAHYGTVTELLAAPNTDPEVKYYLLQAAGNLLAAYDLNDYRSRKHSHGAKEVGSLVAAVQNCVLKADTLLPLIEVTDGKATRKVVPPDQVPVLLFIRRQAIKSLGQVRFAELEVEKGKTLYPAHTLALVATGKVPVETFAASAEKLDFAFAPKNAIGDAADASEAVIGLLNMAPPKVGAAARQYTPPIADAIASGVITWATPRAATPADKSLPWKGTALRMEEGLKTWQGLYDVNYNPSQPAVKADLVPPLATSTAKAITDYVLTPMNSPTGTVSVAGLQTYQRDVLRKDKGFGPRPFTAPDAPTLP